MKRTILCLLLAILMFLCACSSESPAEDFVPMDDADITAATTLPISAIPPELDEDAEPTVSETTIPTVPAQEAVDSRSIRSADPFYEDRAWIEYTEEENRYYGIIDLQGNVLSRIEYHDNMMYWPFSNGFTHTYNYETHVTMIIDKDGDVTYQLDESSLDKPKVIFRGAGILVTVDNVSDFYGTGYQYTIIDHEGNVSEQFVLERELSNIIDCGKGVIRFSGKGYLCLQTHTWVSDDITTQSSCDTPNFVDASSNACVIGVENSEVPQLVFLYTDGSTTKIPVDLSYYDVLRFADFHPLNGDFLFITNDEEYVLSVNIATGEIYSLDAAYRKTLENIQSCSGDRVVVWLRGADDDLYSFIFDQYMNLICGPIDRLWVSAYADSISIGRDSSGSLVAYDEDVNILFSLSELGYTAYEKSILEKAPLEYSCGTLLVCDRNSSPVYLDKEGHLLFDTFNFANTQHIDTTA